MIKWIYIAFVIVAPVFINSASASDESIFIGAIKGNSAVYYPHLQITKIVRVSSASTSGTKKESIIERTEYNNDRLFEGFKDDAISRCKGFDYSVIDNYETTHQIFGEYLNVFTEVTGNVVCLNKKHK